MFRISRRALVRALAVATAFVVAVPLAASAAVTIQKVRATSADEFSPAGAQGVLAWAQTPRGGDTFKVFVREGNKSPRKVNANGTQGYTGGIDGTTLIYQEFKPADGISDIELYDLDTGQRSDPPAKVNTNKWEYHPSMSGSFILFARLTPATGLRQIVLVDTDANTSRILDSIKGKDTSLFPGQVNGDFATWSKCGPSIKCQVFVQNVAKDGSSAHKVPNPDKYQYAPSIDADGTVYFGRSGLGCGANVTFMRAKLGGKPTKFADLPDGIDFADTYAYADDAGKIHVLFDRIKCSTGAADIYAAING